MSTDQAADIMSKMRTEAGRQGCDAIIMQGSNDATQVSGSGNNVSSTTLKGYRATCIVYK